MAGAMSPNEVKKTLNELDVSKKDSPTRAIYTKSGGKSKGGGFKRK